MNTRLPDADGTHRLGQLPNGVKLHVAADDPAEGKTFEWPCSKRRAHGKHYGCPGVKAHPKTMIGGKLL